LLDSGFPRPQDLVMGGRPEEEPGAEVPQKPIELILLRRLASRLSLPIGLFDANRKLVYLNEAAEKLIAARLEDLAETSQTEITDLLRPTDAHGKPIPAERMPSGLALSGRPSQHNIWLNDLQGGGHWCAVTGLPLDTQDGGAVGAMTIVWEIGDSDDAPPALP
jgi:PAS domain-containing protein